MNEDAATLKLLKDYQDNGRRIGSMANVVHSRAQALHRLATLLLESPRQVTPVAGGFEVPSSAPAVIDNVVIQMEEMSLQVIHEELTALVAAHGEAERLEKCLKTAGFPDFIRDDDSN